MNPIIFHIDVNSAYLSWTAVEKLKDGETMDLRTIPSIIGGDQSSRHGVVLAKSSPAKVYGIHTGEPVVNALRKCPDLQMAPPNHALYQKYSQRLMEFLVNNVTSDIEQTSVDECFLDFTGIEKRYSSPVDAAILIKEMIYKELGFTVNIGISSNKLLAKMASDFQKPNCVHTLFPEEIETKMWPLPIAKLHMAGRASVEKLKKLEIRTIGELARFDRELIILHLKKHGKMLWEYANGIDNRPMQLEESELKGIGNSTTLSEDINTIEGANEVFRWLSEKVSSRLRKGNKKANVICVEVRYDTFENVSRQRQLIKATNTNDIVYRTACELFKEVWNGQGVRLLGIRTSKLVEESEPEQLSLFDLQSHASGEMPNDEKHQKVDKAMDEIRRKYGKDAIKRGTFLDIERR